MNKSEIEQAAREWFGPEADKFIKQGTVSLDRIVEYFLMRHPWLKIGL